MYKHTSTSLPDPTNTTCIREKYLYLQTRTAAVQVKIRWRRRAAAGRRRPASCSHDVVSAFQHYCTLSQNMPSSHKFPILCTHTHGQWQFMSCSDSTDDWPGWNWDASAETSCRPVGRQSTISVDTQPCQLGGPLMSPSPWLVR